MQAAFVDHPDFAASPTRPALFTGFLRYLQEWEGIETASGLELLHRVWIGGSFASAKVDPEDVDVTPLISRTSIETLRGRPGSGRVKGLFEQRKNVRRNFKVEPFAVLASPFTALKLQNLDAHDYEYVASRGMMDDFWQRTTTGGKHAMLAEDATPRRGYLEVDPWR
ncbi:hypothetical protein ASG69_04410 [Rhodococcus sp. Leaf225]|nr:hypothetical protein ASG69_04410 [Rhodococcus sp. Leaf225]KQU44789.1 hypothetical protein ASH03_12730 [Rhodococcus sp. Leaf258]